MEIVEEEGNWENRYKGNKGKGESGFVVYTIAVFV